MKTIFRYLCGWMALMAVAACTSDDLQEVVDMQKPVAQKTISVKAYTPSEQAATRLDFNEDTNDGSLALKWSEDDAFTAVIGDTKVAFTYNTESKEFTAEVPEDVTLADGVKAYYPAYEDEFTTDLSTQTGKLNSATTYMEGEYTNGAFSFSHLTAILKAKFEDLPNDEEISSIVISGAATINITGNDIEEGVVYINLPAIPKDGQLKFLVETTTGGYYSSTQTVQIDDGIEEGIFYTAPIALQEACALPTGSDFVAAIQAIDEDRIVSSIVFKANVTDATPSTRSDSNYSMTVEGEVLTISTSLSDFVFNADCSNMFYDLDNIESIDFGNCVNTANVTNMSSMFSYCEKLTSLNVSSFNTAKVTNMNRMFYYCEDLASLDLRSFDFSAVTNFDSMFAALGETATYTEDKPILVYVTQAGYDILNTKSTTGISNTCYVLPYASMPTGSEFNSAVETFLNGKSLTEIKFIANSENVNKTNRILNYQAYMVANGNTLEIHTPANEFVFNADCNGMFRYLSNITSIDFGDCVNTAEVENMSNMFSSCSALTSLNVSSFNTANVTNMSYMFSGCSSLASLNVSSFNTVNVTNMSYMFTGCSSFTSLNVSSFNTVNVTNMAGMFYNCSSLTSLDLSSFNTASVTDMNYMFYECSKLTSLDLSSFNTASVTNMSYMFNGCSKLTSLDLSSFNTASVTNMSYMFTNCYSLTSLDLNRFDFSAVTNFDDMFRILGQEAYYTTNEPIPVYVTQAGYNVLKKQSTTGINVYATYVTPPCNLPTGNDFKSVVGTFLNGKSLTKIKFISKSDVSDYSNKIDDCEAYLVANGNTLEIHTPATEFMFNENCSKMFSDLQSIESIDFDDGVNTAKVEDMSNMFYNCKALTSLDLSNFDTSSVTDMDCMFMDCSSLESIIFGNRFDTSKVEYMSSMFQGCSKLTSLNLLYFKTSEVTMMDGMFYDCHSLTELDLRYFDFDEVTDFDDMFYALGRDAAIKPVYIYVANENVKAKLEAQPIGIANYNYAEIKVK